MTINHTTDKSRIVSHRSVAASVFLLAMAAGGYHFGVTTLVPRDRTSFIFESSSADFGAVWASDDVKVVLSLRNPTSSQIQLVGFDASCSCASIKPAVLIIDPGESRDVLVTLDLIRAFPAGKPPGTHDVDVEVFAHYEHNGRLGAEICVVRGRAHFPLVPPAALRFTGADSIFERRRPPTKSVVLFVASDVTALTADCPTGLATTEVRRQSGRDPGYVVEVTPSAHIPAGAFAFEVELTAYGTDGIALPAVPLQVNGMALPDIFATPDTVLLAGDEGADSETITLQSVSGTAFTVKSVQVTGDAADALRWVRSTGDERVFAVKSLGVQRGTTRAEVIFSVRGDSGSESDVRVPLVIHGTTVTPAMNARPRAAYSIE